MTKIELVFNYLKSRPNQHIHYVDIGKNSGCWEGNGYRAVSALLTALLTNYPTCGVMRSHLKGCYIYIPEAARPFKFARKSHNTNPTNLPVTTHKVHEAKPADHKLLYESIHIVSDECRILIADNGSIWRASILSDGK